MATEFGAAATLDVTVDPSSLREAKAEIENELGDLTVGVDAGVSTSRTQPRDPRTGQFASKRGAEQRLLGLQRLGEDIHDLAEIRNDLLRGLVDETEEGNRIRARGGGGGLGTIGMIGLGLGVGALGGALLNFEFPDLPKLEAPDIPPLRVPDIPPLEVPEIPPLEVPEIPPVPIGGAPFPIPIPVRSPTGTGTPDLPPVTDPFGGPLVTPEDIPTETPTPTPDIDVPTGITGPGGPALVGPGDIPGTGVPEGAPGVGVPSGRGMGAPSPEAILTGAAGGLFAASRFAGRFGPQLTRGAGAAASGAALAIDRPTFMRGLNKTRELTGGGTRNQARQSRAGGATVNQTINVQADGVDERRVERIAEEKAQELRQELEREFSGGRIL